MESVGSKGIQIMLPYDSNGEAGNQKKTKRELWDDFLDEIAGKVDELTLEEKNLRAFRESIRPFGERWKKQRAREKNWEDRVAVQGAKDWRRAEKDARFRNRDVRPKGKLYWDPTCGCGRELVERDGKRYCTMPACLGDRYKDHLLERVAYARKSMNRLSPKDLRKKKCAKGMKTWTRYLQEVKAELAREAQTPTGYLLLDHPWWSDYPNEKEIGEHFGCWRKNHFRPHHIVDEWFPVNDHSPEKLPRLDVPDERQRRYIVLSSIHDNRLPDTQIATEDIWPSGLARYLWLCVNVCHPDAYGPRQTYIRAALRRIAAELRQSPADKRKLKDQEPARKGRRPKYTDSILALASKRYEDLIVEGRDVKGAWAQVAADYGIESKSGNEAKAAEMAVRRWKTRQNQKTNQNK